MVAHLLCLTAEGGVPLFNRKKGDVKALPFPLVASLNGVQMFGKSHAVSLLSTATKDARVIWQEFEGSIVLIVVCSFDYASDSYLQHLLNMVFCSMVLLLGLDDITQVKNIERLKRDLRACYKMIDMLLDGLEPREDVTAFGELTACGDCLLCAEPQTLQGYLDTFVENVDSTYGCLLVHGKIAAATKNWWSLSGLELALLNLFMASGTKCTSRDTPVFLPVRSPTVPFRLVTCQMMQGVDVCVLCGPTPSLGELEKEVFRFWKPAFETLKIAESIHPKNYPSSFTLDKSVLGFLLVNRKKNKCISSVHQHQSSGGRKEGKLHNGARRLDILRSFYQSVVGTVFSKGSSDSEEEKAVAASHADDCTSLKHQPLETYLSSDYHKCYAVCSPPYQIFILFVSAVPNHTMRNITKRTLLMFTRDKTIQF